MYRPTGGRLNTQSPHKQYIHSLCSLRSRRALARSRSLALRSSPRQCSARFAGHLACCSLRFALPAGSRHSPPRLLLSLRSCFACCLAPVPCFARALPSARFARQLACCSLRSPARLLLAALALPAARSSPLRLLRSPPRQLLSLRSPPRLRLLASLAASPAAARFARRLAHSPVSLALSASPSRIILRGRHT